MKMFSQDEVNRLIAAEKRRFEARIKELETQVAASTEERARFETTSRDLESLRTKHNAMRQRQVERDVLALLRAARKGSASAKVLSGAETAALRLFTLEAKFEQNEGGDVTAVVFRGARYDDPAAAAYDFLVDNDCLMAANRPSGGGSTGNVGSGGFKPPPADLTKVDPGALIANGLQQKV